MVMVAGSKGSPVVGTREIPAAVRAASSAEERGVLEGMSEMRSAREMRARATGRLAGESVA
jgi:hypothetical protein